MLLFAASGHLVVRGTSPSSRGPLKRKGGGKTLIFDNAGPTIAELLLCIVIPVNQLSIYGAVADWYQELPQRVEVHCPECTGTLVELVDKVLASQVPSDNMYRVWSHRAQVNFGAVKRGEVWKSPEFFSIMKSLRRRWFFEEKLQDTVRQVFVQKKTYPRSNERSQLKGFIRCSSEIGLVLEVMVPKRCHRDGSQIKIDSLKKEGIQSWMVISRDVEEDVTDPTKRFREPGKLLRWKKGQSNFYRLHFRRRFCRSNNKSGKKNLPLMTTIAEIFQTRWQ